MFEPSEPEEVAPTTHPRRRRRKGSPVWAKLRAQPEPLTGRALKNALMPRARELARTGLYPRWIDLVRQFPEWEQDALRAFISDADRDELEMLS